VTTASATVERVNEPKIVIVVPTQELAASLLIHGLRDLPGQKGMAVDLDQGYFDAHLDEFPRTPSDLDRVIAAVQSWLAETELPAITIESRWRVEPPRKPQAPEKLRRVLTWKLEDGPADAPKSGSPDDVGPAWLDTPGPDGTTSEEVADGKSITRAEARQLAEEEGNELSDDD
jgi:hypothetical protein